MLFDDYSKFIKTIWPAYTKICKEEVDYIIDAYRAQDMVKYLSLNMTKPLKIDKVQPLTRDVVDFNSFDENSSFADDICGGDELLSDLKRGFDEGSFW